MKDNLGMDVMINMLRGNKDTIEAVKKAIGKVIRSCSLQDDFLIITFDDGSVLKLWDDGQSCCESRYMVIDDDLNSFAGAKLVTVEVRDAPDEKDEYNHNSRDSVT